MSMQTGVIIQEVLHVFLHPKTTLTEKSVQDCCNLSSF